MSPDFLVNYMAFGPRREVSARDSEHVLPLALDEHVIKYAPKDLFELAERIRSELGDLPER